MRCCRISNFLLRISRRTQIWKCRFLERAAAGAPNDGVVAAAGGADAEEAGSTLAVGAPKRPAEGVGLKGDAAGANGTVIAGIVEACRLSAAGFEEAAGVGVALASPDFETAGASDVVVT